MVTRSAKGSTKRKSSASTQVEGTRVESNFEVVNSPNARLYIADDIRSESSGKIMAIGLYSDLVVILQIPADAPPATEEIPYGLGKLVFLINIRGVVGTGPVKIQLAEGGPESTRTVTIHPGGSANVIVTVQPMLIKSFGVKRATVSFGGHVLHMEYEIRQQTIPVGGREMDGED